MSYSSQVIADGAINYWRLDETTGTTAVDAKAVANGTISGGVALNQPGAITDGTAMAFDGSTGKVNAGNIAAANFLAGSFTVEAWIKIQTGSAFQVVTGKGDENGAGWRAFITSGNFPQLFWGTNVQSYTISTLPVTVGVWQHVVWGYDAGAGAVFYAVNGVYQSFVIANHSVTNTLSVIIGGCDSAVLPFMFSGSIDEVALYSSALTSAKITAHFVSGAISRDLTTLVKNHMVVLRAAAGGGALAVDSTTRFTKNIPTMRSGRDGAGLRSADRNCALRAGERINAASRLDTESWAGRVVLAAGHRAGSVGRVAQCAFLSGRTGDQARRGHGDGGIWTLPAQRAD
jgi:hypothetical protein